jgi:hypothetical protein
MNNENEILTKIQSENSFFADILTNPLQSESQKLEQLQISIRIYINKYGRLPYDFNGIVTLIANTSNTSNASLPKSPSESFPSRQLSQQHINNDGDDNSLVVIALKLGLIGIVKEFLISIFQKYSNCGDIIVKSLLQWDQTHPLTIKAINSSDLMQFDDISSLVLENQNLNYNLNCQTVSSSSSFHSPMTTQNSSFNNPTILSSPNTNTYSPHGGSKNLLPLNIQPQPLYTISNQTTQILEHIYSLLSTPSENNNFRNNTAEFEFFLNNYYENNPDRPLFNKFGFIIQSIYLVDDASPPNTPLIPLTLSNSSTCTNISSFDLQNTSQNNETHNNPQNNPLPPLPQPYSHPHPPQPLSTAPNHSLNPSTLSSPLQPKNTSHLMVKYLHPFSIFYHALVNDKIPEFQILLTFCLKFFQKTSSTILYDIILSKRPYTDFISAIQWCIQYSNDDQYLFGHPVYYNKTIWTFLLDGIIAQSNLNIINTPQVSGMYNIDVDIPEESLFTHQNGHFDDNCMGIENNNNNFFDHNFGNNKQKFISSIKNAINFYNSLLFTYSLYHLQTNPNNGISLSSPLQLSEMVSDRVEFMLSTILTQFGPIISTYNPKNPNSTQILSDLYSPPSSNIYFLQNGQNRVLSSPSSSQSSTFSTSTPQNSPHKRPPSPYQQYQHQQNQFMANIGCDIHIPSEKTHLLLLFVQLLYIDALPYLTPFHSFELVITHFRSIPDIIKHVSALPQYIRHQGNFLPLPSHDKNFQNFIISPHPFLPTLPPLSLTNTTLSNLFNNQIVSGEYKEVVLAGNSTAFSPPMPPPRPPSLSQLSQQRMQVVLRQQLLTAKYSVDTTTSYSAGCENSGNFGHGNCSFGQNNPPNHQFHSNSPNVSFNNNISFSNISQHPNTPYHNDISVASVPSCNLLHQQGQNGQNWQNVQGGQSVQQNGQICHNIPKNDIDNINNNNIDIKMKNLPPSLTPPTSFPIQPQLQQSNSSISLFSTKLDRRVDQKFGQKFDQQLNQKMDKKIDQNNTNIIPFPVFVWIHFYQMNYHPLTILQLAVCLSDQHWDCLERFGLLPLLYTQLDQLLSLSGQLNITKPIEYYSIATTPCYFVNFFKIPTRFCLFFSRTISVLSDYLLKPSGKVLNEQPIEYLQSVLGLSYQAAFDIEMFRRRAFFLLFCAKLQLFANSSEEEEYLVAFVTRSGQYKTIFGYLDSIMNHRDHRIAVDRVFVSNNDGQNNHQNNHQNNTAFPSNNNNNNNNPPPSEFKLPNKYELWISSHHSLIDTIEERQSYFTNVIIPTGKKIVQRHKHNLLNNSNYNSHNNNDSNFFPSKNSSQIYNSQLPSSNNSFHTHSTHPTQPPIFALSSSGSFHNPKNYQGGNIDLERVQSHHSHHSHQSHRERDRDYKDSIGLSTRDVYAALPADRLRDRNRNYQRFGKITTWNHGGGGNMEDEDINLDTIM